MDKFFVRAVIIVTLPVTFLLGLFYGLIVGAAAWFEDMSLAWRYPRGTRLAKWLWAKRD